MDIFKRIFFKTENKSSQVVNLHELRELNELDKKSQKIKNQIICFEKEIIECNQYIDENLKKIEYYEKKFEMYQNMTIDMFKEYLLNELEKIDELIDKLKCAEKKNPLTLNELNQLEKLNNKQYKIVCAINDLTLLDDDEQLNFLNQTRRTLRIKINHLIANNYSIEHNQIRLKRHILKYREEYEKLRKEPINNK